MTLILIEMLLAALVFVGIVWWTMFSGRRGGERRIEDHPGAATSDGDRARRASRREGGGSGSSKDHDNDGDGDGDGDGGGGGDGGD